ncbi:MAG: DUF368 domain-containing protein [Verrucomicrobiota bacterium]
MNFILLFLKGIAMGAANVIPGVSGGTIAFVTGIYEDFIDALKSFDAKALKLALSFKVRELLAHIRFSFLFPLFLGVLISLVSLGKLFDWLFIDHPMLTWAFFFGLILASVYYVSKNIKRWNSASLISFVIGVSAASSLAFLKPAEENDSFIYLALCGIVAICSMILPGLSGSFVLILMGNYQLLVLQTIPNTIDALRSFDFPAFLGNLKTLLPFAVGAGFGFITLSHVISFLLKRAHDATLSVLTGFILGSLIIIWPWKNETYLQNETGEFILKEGEKIVQGYQWFSPSFTETSTYLGLGLILAGIISVALLERTAQK